MEMYIYIYIYIYRFRCGLHLHCADIGSELLFPHPLTQIIFVLSSGSSLQLAENAFEGGSYGADHVSISGCNL